MTLRIIKLLSCFLISIYWIPVHAEPKYPVDISYMVCDFKYSQEHGLKICEVQHGAVSAVAGDLYISGGNGSIPPMIASYFDQFPLKKWVAGMTYSPLRKSLLDYKWTVDRSVKMLSKNLSFLECAVLPPADPFSISSYRGIVYAACDIFKNFNFYHKAYPGVIFIDAATLSYWVDKYKINTLFNHSSELKAYKAEWQLHPKKYDPQLARGIQENMPSELYVIKPRREFLGKGVIVVANEDLDSVLKMILEPDESLKKHPDISYSFWWINKDDTFLIEKYYKSDYLHFSEPLTESANALTSNNGGDYQYDATMRIAFILKYDEGKMTYHCLGGFWKLPCKSLQEEGTLNEKRISFGSPPFYRAVNPELLLQASSEMEKAMLLLYEVMLNDSSF